MPSKFYHSAEDIELPTPEEVFNGVPEEHRSHIAPLVGLGRTSVLLSAQRVLGEGTPEDSELLRQSLDEALETIKEFDSDQKNRFNIFIDEFLEESSFIRTILVPDAPNDSRIAIDYASVLVEHDTQTGDYVLSGEQQLNVLQWYNYELVKLNREFNETKREPLLDQFKKRFQDLIHDGLIPRDAASYLERLDHLLITVDDGLLTDFRGLLGTHINTPDNKGHINLSPHEASAMELDRPSSYETLFHELTHAMHGQSSPKESSHADQWRHNDTAGLMRTFGYEKDEDGGLILNEAVTETLAQLLTYTGMDETTAMKVRGAYRTERKLLLALTSDGLEPVPLKDFVAAFIEQDDTTAQDHLYEALRSAFPWTDIITDVRTINREEMLSPYRDGFMDFIRRVGISRNLEHLTPDKALDVVTKTFSHPDADRQLIEEDDTEYALRITGKMSYLIRNLLDIATQHPAKVRAVFGATIPFFDYYKKRMGSDTSNDEFRFETVYELLNTIAQNAPHEPAVLSDIADALIRNQVISEDDIFITIDELKTAIKALVAVGIEPTAYLNQAKLSAAIDVLMTDEYLSPNEVRDFFEETPYTPTAAQRDFYLKNVA